MFVYFSYTGGALLTVRAWTLTLADAQVFIAQRWLDPFAIVAAVIARELPIWFGGWIAAHGRTVNERNRVALEEYDRMIAAGPKLQQHPDAPHRRRAPRIHRIGARALSAATLLCRGW